MKRSKKLPGTTMLIKNAVAELADLSFDMLEAFIFSCGSTKILARNMGMLDSKYYSSMQSLSRNGYIKKINNDQFLITPKMLLRLAEIDLMESDWADIEWDGSWKIIAFDIPESKKRERNIFRSLIKRMGFIGIQNSVFIAPYADFEQLANLRVYLKIEKYISFFEAKSAATDDDQALREKFNLK